MVITAESPKVTTLQGETMDKKQKKMILTKAKKTLKLHV